MSISLELASPSMAVVQLLDQKVINPPGVQLMWGRNLLRCEPRFAGNGTPVQAVFVYTSGGAAPRQYHDDLSILIASVYVHVRGQPNAFGQGEDLARGVLAALHRTIPTGYVDCLSNVSEPEFAGTNNTEQPSWLISLSLTREE